MTLSQYIDKIKSKRVAVLGVGVSNTPLIRRLLEGGCQVTARDKSPREKLAGAAEELERLGARLALGESYLDGLDEDMIFRTPGMRPDVPQIVEAVKRGAELTSEMEVFFEVCPCRMIGVTGSDGKTTTTTIISELLRAQGYTVHLGGNIGKPLLCEADGMSPEDFAVLELSSFQLMTMRRSPDTAVVTNLAPNHLDMHRDMDEYVSSKKNVFLHQGAKGVTILNADNAITAGFEPECGGRVRLFSRRARVSDGFFVENGEIYSASEGRTEKILKVEDIRLPGVHNVENYLAAFAATEPFVSPETMKRVAQTFGGVEHRIELVRELRGVRYYNDSIASSPSRTAAGLRSFNQRVVLIAGGKDKGVPFDELGELICERVKALVLTGLTAGKLRAAVEGAAAYKGEPAIYVVDDFRDAVLKASDIAVSGDVVMLSPACTSFDRFKNFSERGEFFKKIINGLK